MGSPQQFDLLVQRTLAQGAAAGGLSLGEQLFTVALVVILVVGIVLARKH